MHVATDKELLVLNCTICTDDYEAPDMMYCPFHKGSLCSLCYTLEKESHNIAAS
jgi:hypothetical protein